MISVSRRSLLLFNFGIAMVFIVIGSLSVYSLDLVRPNRASEPIAFAKEARLAIAEEQSIDAVRARTLYYFDIARDMRRARLRDEVETYNDVRILSFVVAGLFLVGGAPALLLPAPQDVPAVRK